MRYLGGGVGHLEQFPPANNDNGALYEDEAEVEDDLGAGDIEHCESDQDDEEGEDDEEEGEGDEDMDPGESSDEDAGNVY